MYVCVICYNMGHAHRKLKGGETFASFTNPTGLQTM